MFQDARGRKVVFIAHCMMNQNSISDGTASFPGTNEIVLRLLLDAKVGVVQMPCPEMNCLGLDRGDPEGANRPLLEENSRIRDAMSQTGTRRVLQTLVDHVVFQMEEYRKHSFEILGMIGINRSPSCGVNTTSSGGMEVIGMGVFFQALAEELARRNITDIPVIGVKDSEPEKTEQAVKQLLCGNCQ